jgi:hypothetical protein
MNGIGRPTISARRLTPVAERTTAMNTRLGIFVVLAVLTAANPLWAAEEPDPCPIPPPSRLRRLLDHLHLPHGGCTACQTDKMFIFSNEYEFFREFYFPLPPQPPSGFGHGCPGQ